MIDTAAVTAGLVPVQEMIRLDGADMELVDDRTEHVKTRIDRAFWGLRELLVNLHV